MNRDMKIWTNVYKKTLGLNANNNGGKSYCIPYKKLIFILNTFCTQMITEAIF